MKHLAKFLLAAVCLASPAVYAQTAAQTPQGPPSSVPACAGTAGIVRISEIKPGKLDIFLSAVELQAAWYKSHGMPEHIIYAARMSDRDPVTGTLTQSETQVMTFHYNVLSGTGAPHDDAYNEFVKMFRDSSSIKNEYGICTTKKI